MVTAAKKKYKSSKEVKREKIQYNNFKNDCICRAVRMLLDMRESTNGKTRGDISMVVKMCNMPSIVNADSIYYRLKRYNEGIPLDYFYRPCPKQVVCKGSSNSTISSVTIAKPAAKSTKSSTKPIVKTATISSVTIVKPATSKSTKPSTKSVVVKAATTKSTKPSIKPLKKRRAKYETIIVARDGYKGIPTRTGPFDEVLYNEMKGILIKMTTRNDSYAGICSEILLDLPRIYNKPDMIP